ncbi:MAG: restriction endonuclease subunit S [Veillonella sp.]|uniref:restriction endonuclease subunit S n=1 Tax=Veillonella sp. TaxID=1926307 RepID=UPI002915675D|nr:restriction endonuclease subunit S [Veillonella sp.]MDU3601931.1 restriction endonuclease subunit S [Veillonella sp.]
MMSGAKKRVPKRRFKEFLNAGEWEQRKLGEIADITKLAGFEFTKYIVYSDKGNIIALRGLNIKDGDLNLEDVKYIDNSDFTKLKRSKLFRNDILFTYVGTIGEVARIQEDDKYYLAPNVSRIRIKNRLLSEFLMYYMDRDLFYQKIIFPLIATSSQPALSMANIREFNITYPSGINEQQKIALIFSRISHLITLHQRKLDKLQATKKALLQEMFPEEGQDKPKRRFKGFTDAWEQRKLISLYKTIRNAFVGTATPYYTNDSINGYFYLESNNVKNGKINRNNEIYITKDFYQKQEDKLLYKDDIVIVQSGHVGHTAVIPEELDKTAAHALIMLQNKKENFDSHFINNSFQTPLIRNKIDEITTGNTIKHILASDVKNIVINMPSFKEQKLISQLFKLLDLNITLHQRKLDKLKNLKQAYLNEMFV